MIPRTNVITLVVSISSLIFLFGGKVWLNPLLTKVLKKKILIPFELILVDYCSFLFNFNICV